MPSAKESASKLSTPYAIFAGALKDQLNGNEYCFFIILQVVTPNVQWKYAEAEKVYKEDLKTWRKNGWALIGLYNALALQNKNSEAQKAKSSFEAS